MVSDFEHHPPLGQLPQDFLGTGVRRNFVTCPSSICGAAAHPQLQLDRAAIRERAPGFEFGEHRAHGGARGHDQLNGFGMRTGGAHQRRCCAASR